MEKQAFTAKIVHDGIQSKSCKVLELGANVGRNTLVIASLLDDPRNLVTLESSKDVFPMLLENRKATAHVFPENKLFRAENAALSKTALMQRGWQTVHVPKGQQEISPGFLPVDIISFSDLEAKYEIQFNTLIIDSEGSIFYSLFEDAENILRNITLIIIENDFQFLQHKEFIDASFRDAGFSLVYNQAGGFGPCFSVFYQVWHKVNKNQ